MSSLNISNFIWNIADDVLRDVYVRGKYRDVILPMTVIRRLDAVLEPTKDAVLRMKAQLDAAGVANQRAALCRASDQAFYNTSSFRLRDLTSRGKQQQLKADFEAFLDGFSSNVEEVLGKFKFRNQIPTLIEADVLGFLIEKFVDNSINLSPEPILYADGSVRLPGLDNHSMGTIFEELIRRFNEENNEEAGEHFTPRDVVELMAHLVLLPIADKIRSGTFLVYDGACGTGGMLTVAEETLVKLAARNGKDVSVHLYGQEVNPETFAISKADLILKGEGLEAENMKFGSTLSGDAFPSREFDFMLSNPPYGKSWKTDLARMGGKKGMRDPRFVVEHADNPEYSLITRSNDGQMLFLANMLSKMKQGTRLGSRIAEVHNGSSLFTGNAGQGESNIRRWIIENDWLEAIVALPLNIFYNTGIATYIWVLTNRKSERRRGKVQLIDASQWFKPLRKNLGKKNCRLSIEDIRRICDTFLAFEETGQSRIFPNRAFGYWKVTVERPLRIEGADPNRAFTAAEIRKLKEGGERSENSPPVIRKIHKMRYAARSATRPVRGQHPRRARRRGVRGVIDVLRKGVKHGPAFLELFFGTPSPGNTKAEELFAANIFSVSRQVRYSKDNTKLSLDLAIFINGLPVVTFELKNSLTKQTVEDAIQQYKRDRDPKELLFQFGRCVVHFAVDDHEVRMCTHLKGKGSWFLPFNQGWHDGAGNPPNPRGLKTDYLWKEVLTKRNLTDILENYAQVVREKDDRGRKKAPKQIFPRFHQLDVVRKLLAEAKASGPGKRYLVQHSAGSGKSNSIAWLAHQIIGLETGGRPMFDSVIVVTDRRVLDRQIRDTIKQFAQVSSVVGHAERSGDLRAFLNAGKKITITTVQKFPFILQEIGDEHRNRTFAIIIDEAHSSQGGRMSAAISIAVGTVGAAREEETIEDKINRLVESKKLPSNASYFAFTATPKNKTLELFGEPVPNGVQVGHVPSHSYTMKQATDEGFILDVLEHYTPVNSYYRLMKTVQDDPLFDSRKAQKKLRRYVESNDHAIRQKAEIMVDHFHDQVMAHRKIGGKARAMVVTSGVQRAIQYFHAFEEYLHERRSPYRTVVAFSGKREYGGRKVNEASLNGFPSSKIVEKIREDPYRFLVCADKFQTGYDEPLLHTMYVDKVLSGIKAVQTISRLNRAHPQKHDTFVLDCMNDAEGIGASFAPYYRTTILSEETDPNKLHDLKDALDDYQVYNWGQVEDLVSLYVTGADRDKLDPILDRCVVNYRSDLDEDGQVDFKGKAKAFTRAYGFLSLILPYTNAEWERLSIFLTFLTPKLPAPEEQDLSKGILETIDMDSYRAEVRAKRSIVLPDEDGEIGPVPTNGGGGKPEPEVDYLSSILKTFNDLFGDIEWKDEDKIGKVIAEELPKKVAADKAYQNAMKNSDRQNARIEHDKALERAVIDLLSDHTELFKQFSDNSSFRKWLSDNSFARTYHQGTGSGIHSAR